MKVYRDGIEIYDLPITASAKHKVTLMKEDYVSIPFVSCEELYLKSGDYIVFEDKKYILMEDYIPSMKDELTFNYELKFNAPWYNLETYQFLFNTEVDGIIRRESDWSITDTAAGVLRLIVNSTSDKERDCPCRFSDFVCEPTEVKTFQYSSTSVLGALNQLASDYEMEWWVEDLGDVYVIHFGECDSSIVTEDGNVVFNADGSRKKDESFCINLTTGVNIGSPTIKQNERMARYYYVYGSSRNIDQSWSETNITQIATRRLSLNNPIDKFEGSGDEVVIFDDIYPKSDYRINYVDSFQYTSEDIAYYDNDNNPIYKVYTIYQVRINEFSDYVLGLIKRGELTIFNDVIASGKTLMMKFITHNTGSETITPQLSGFEFEVAVRDITYLSGTHENPKADGTQRDRWFEFQIIKQEINGFSVPNQNLKPNVGDYVCLYNIKSKYIDGSEEINSLEELQKQFDKYYSNKKKNVTYTVKPYVDSNLNLNIGDAVKLTYSGNVVLNRVVSFEKSIDYSIDATYNLSYYTTKGTVNSLKEQVTSLSLTMGNINVNQSSSSTAARDGLWNLVTRDDGSKYIHGKYDVAVDGNIVAYLTQDDKFRETTVMDGVIVDNDTIIKSNGKLVATGCGGGEYITNEEIDALW